MLPRKTSIAIGTFALLAGALHWLPGVLPRAPRSPKPELHPVVALPSAVARPNPAADPNLIVPPGSLDTFFAALHRTENEEEGAVARILHYGDSPTTADSITADVRRLFQARFGDAGHGFLLIAKPWAWYGHSGVALDGKGWKIEPASQSRAADGFHGLGGVSFRTEGGATSRVSLPEGHTRATVAYLAQPGGGTFTVYAGETKLAEVNTAMEVKTPAWAGFALPPGTLTLELRAGPGKVRLFGYRFDKDRPGVQYSSLGVNGAQVQMMARYFETTQWTAALRHEDPDLLVLNYGTNESIYPSYIGKQYPDELRTVISRIRQALPRASLLVMSPMDRGVMTGGEISTPPALEKLIEVQKQIAAETGCAFFNTYQAMGGAGTMGRWYHAQPRLVSADFMHPLPQGAAKVGALFETALVAAYEGAPGPGAAR